MERVETNGFLYDIHKGFRGNIQAAGLANVVDSVPAGPEPFESQIMVNFSDIYGIEQNWDYKKALERCKKARGPFEYISDLLNAHAHLSKKEWPKFCAELNMTTKQAQKTNCRGLPNYGLAIQNT